MPHLQRGWFRFNWKQINELCRKFKKLGRSAKRIMKRLWICQLCFKIGKYICIHMRFFFYKVHIFYIYHGRLAVNLIPEYVKNEQNVFYIYMNKWRMPKTERLNVELKTMFYLKLFGTVIKIIVKCHYRGISKYIKQVL